MRAALLLGGDLFPGPALSAALAETQLVIAADGGIRHAAPLGLTPDLWVGDFDSSSEDLLRRYPSVPREVHPRDKDATDAELAARAALFRGARELLWVGAFGAEADHALGHLGLALALADQGVPVALTDGRTWGWPLVPPGRTIRLPPESRLSLVPWSELRGLTIEGARWELDRANLPLGSTRALRNLARGPVRLGLADGRGIVLAWPAASSGFSPFSLPPAPRTPSTPPPPT